MQFSGGHALRILAGCATHNIATCIHTRSLLHVVILADFLDQCKTASSTPNIPLLHLFHMLTH